MNVKNKTCLNCQKTKNIDDFQNYRPSKDGKNATCKSCVSERKKKYYRKNRLVILEKAKQRYRENTEAIRKRNNISLRKFRKNNKLANDRIQKKYRTKNKLKLNKRERLKWRSNPRLRLKKLISNKIWFSLKQNKNGRHWESLVGYTVDDLERNLKRKIPKGYVWGDFLNGKLHIDHKIPVTVFNFERPEDTDFKKCWALSNLQLLPAKENIKKGAKLDKPFQPSLKGI